MYKFKVNYVNFFFSFALSVNNQQPTPNICYLLYLLQAWLELIYFLVITYICIILFNSAIFSSVIIIVWTK